METVSNPWGLLRGFPPRNDTSDASSRAKRSKLIYEKARMTGTRRWRWGRALLLAASLALLTACGAPGGTPTPAPQPPSASQVGPRIKFEQEAVDFGRQPYDRVVEQTFRFRNEGDAPLVIQPLVVVRVVEGC